MYIRTRKRIKKSSEKKQMHMLMLCGRSKMYLVVCAFIFSIIGCFPVRDLSYVYYILILHYMIWCLDV